MNLTLRRSIVAAVVLAAPLLSSCSLQYPTDKVYNPGVGVNNRTGSVDVLGAVIVSGSKGSGTLSATFVNNNPNHADGVTRIAGSGKDAGVSVALPGPVDIKPGGTTQISKVTPVIAKGARVKPGFFVTLTFSFKRSQNVTMQIPVVSRRGDYANMPTSAPTSTSPTSGPVTVSPSTPRTKSPSRKPKG